MKYIQKLGLIIIILSCLCANAQRMDPKSRELLNNLTKLNGGYQTLMNVKDVHFTYTKKVKGKKILVSDEKHIFQGEQSLSVFNGKYQKAKGAVKFSLVNNVGTISVNGNIFNDAKAQKKASTVNRITFYWFAMMYKLLDSSTVFTYLGKETVNDVEFEKVKMVFDNSKTTKKVNDEYLLYFNPTTHLVDLFIFSSAGQDVVKNPRGKTFVTYKLIDNVYVPIIRESWVLREGNWKNRGVFTFSDITFNNGYKIEDFLLK